MLVTPAVLNRALLSRQHLLARSAMDPLAMTRHLLGLQAQATLPPYLSLHARLAGFDPLTFSAALADRRIVRLLLMRGTVHAADPADAMTLRQLAGAALRVYARGGTATGRPSTSTVKTGASSGAAGASTPGRPAPSVPADKLVEIGRALLARGPLSVTELGGRLAEHFPAASGRMLTDMLRGTIPLVQVPPRGLWKRSGGVFYATLEDWSGTLPAAAPMTDVVRRYLRAFGPATAADVTAWSGMRATARLLDELGDEIVRYHTDTGRTVLDLAGLELVDPDTPAPVRLLGRYDNLWLSHAGRDRVTGAEERRRWMGSNGGVASTVFVDGWLAGLWRTTPDGAVHVELFGRLTRAQRGELDAEVAAVERLLAR